MHRHTLVFGKLTVCYDKSLCLIGKTTNFLCAIFKFAKCNKLPEGINIVGDIFYSMIFPWYYHSYTHYCPIISAFLKGIPLGANCGTLIPTSTSPSRLGGSQEGASVSTLGDGILGLPPGWIYKTMGKTMGNLWFHRKTHRKMGISWWLTLTGGLEDAWIMTFPFSWEFHVFPSDIHSLHHFSRIDP